MPGLSKYQIAKSLIRDGTLKDFKALFQYLDMSRVAKDLGMHFYTAEERAEKPGGLTIDQLMDLAEYIDIDPMIFINWAMLTRMPGKNPNSGSE